MAKRCGCQRRVSQDLAVEENVNALEQLALKFTQIRLHCEDHRTAEQAGEVATSFRVARRSRRVDSKVLQRILCREFVQRILCDFESSTRFAV